MHEVVQKERELIQRIEDKEEIHQRRENIHGSLEH